MTLLIRAVRLRAQTSVGAAGRTVRFGPAFNVLRGSNSRGKTQVVQAVIYALGLERMLAARANAPLGSVMTSELRMTEDETAPAAPVLSSWVAVSLENAAGDRLTAQRFVRSPRRQANLVRVWSGDAITNPEMVLKSTDYFLHQAGSVSHELGFHHLLLDFLGWQLPDVGTFTGGTCALYPDVIFPFIIVDQQSWGSASPRKVDRYQIRNPLRRAAEFLLGLDGPAAETRRSELENEIAELRASWAGSREAVEALAASVGGRMVGVVEQPAGATARNALPEASSLDAAKLQLLENNEWIDSGEVAARIRTELEAISFAQQRPPLPTVGERGRDELDLVRRELSDVLGAARLLDEDLTTAEAQLAALDRRLDSLRQERERNGDVRTLVRLGSATAAVHLADHNCPTCRQSLDAVEERELGPILNVEETVTMLNAQIRTTERMRERAMTVNAQASSAYAALQRRSDQLRVRLRALESDLLAPAGSASTGDVAHRLTLELRVDELSRARDAISVRVDELAAVAERVAVARSALSRLPLGDSTQDVERIDELAGLVQERLRRSGFGSYAVSEVKIDRDALRPSREGFDVDTDVSASDVVRIKIAYLDSVRRLGTPKGNHPGLLILDEPRQQDIAAEDFGAILGYLAEGSSVGQVIVTSAMPRDELETLAGQPELHMIDLGDARLLQPEDGPDALEAEV